MSPWRIAAALGMVAVLAVALAVVLVGDRRAVGPTAAPAATPSPSPTTSASEVASPTPSPVETTPLELATGEDWMEVARRLEALQEAAFVRLDPEILLLAQHPSCDCYQEDAATIREAQRRQLRNEPSTFEVVSVEVIERFDVHGVAIVVTASYGATRTVDAGGRVVSELPAQRLTTEYALVRTPPEDPQWRIIQRRLLSAENFEGDA